MANQEERCLATLLVKTVAFLAAAGPVPIAARRYAGRFSDIFESPPPEHMVFEM